MRRIAIINQKGGVAKTTTAVNLSAALALENRKVLLIDLDPQANATMYLGLSPKTLQNTSYAVIAGDAKPEETIKNVRDNLYLLPSSVSLVGAEAELAGEIGRETILRERLSGLNSYDFAIIDCPPSLGLLNVNALCYSDEVLIPVQCEFFALNGLSLLLSTVDKIKARLNPSLQIAGALACMYDSRNLLSTEVAGELKAFFKERLFQTKIRVNIRLAEAPSHGKTIFEYAPDSHGAEDYTQLAQELLNSSRDSS